MITGKKNLLIAALEVVAVGIFLKIGYHLGNKLIDKVDSKLNKGSNSKDSAGGGRKRVVEEFTDNELSVIS